MNKRSMTGFCISITSINLLDSVQKLCKLIRT